MKPWIKGADLSSLLEVEACGGVFSDHGATGDAMEILAGYGFNLVRLRLWNDPYSPQGEPYGAGNCDLACVMTLARRAKSLGLDWLLDLHYSDFWADPGKQITPKAWQGLDEDGLEQAVYRYTLDVLCACRAAGVSPDMVQVGNELSFGLLWPQGKTPNYDAIARFVSAGVRAVRAFNPALPVMVHLDNGANNELYRTWFDAYFARGGECDIIGLSYYAMWHGTLNALRDNLTDLAWRYGKPLVLVETSSYFTAEDYAAHEQLPAAERKGPPLRPELLQRLEFPTTPQGQAAYLRAVLELLHQVPEGLGLGFFWWEAAWIPVPGSGWAKQGGWEYVHENGPGGNEWANQALFDYDGNAQPAQRVILERDGAQAG